MAKKQKAMNGILSAPAQCTATLPAIEARMRKAFPPLSSFRKKVKKKGVEI